MTHDPGSGTEKAGDDAISRKLEQHLEKEQHVLAGHVAEIDEPKNQSQDGRGNAAAVIAPLLVQRSRPWQCR